MLRDVDHEAAQPPALRGMHAIAQPDLAAIGGVRAELVLERTLGGEGVGVSREHPIAIARVDDLRPDVGGAEPALDGIAEQLLGPLAHERAGQRDGIGLPDDRVDAVHEITEPALGSFCSSGAVRTVVSHGTVAGAEIASHVPRMPWRHVRL